LLPQALDTDGNPQRPQDGDGWRKMMQTNRLMGLFPCARRHWVLCNKYTHRTFWTNNHEGRTTFVEQRQGLVDAIGVLKTCRSVVSNIGFKLEWTWARSQEEEREGGCDCGQRWKPSKINRASALQLSITRHPRRQKSTRLLSPRVLDLPAETATQPNAFESGLPLPQA